MLSADPNFVSGSLTGTSTLISKEDITIFIVRVGVGGGGLGLGFRLGLRLES